MILLTAFAFGQASIAMAGCEMERGEMGAVLAGSTGAPPCENCGTVIEPGGQFSNRCVAHCTADLSNAGQAALIMPAPGLAPVLAVLAPPPLRDHRTARAAPPPGTPPARVLQHAYLI